MWPKANFEQISTIISFSCESTDRELSFEWLHHRISFTDSKVRVTLQTQSNTLAVKGLMGKTVYLVSIKNNRLDCLNHSKNFCIDRHDAGKSIYYRLDLLNRSQLHNVITYLLFCQRSKGSKGRMFPTKSKVYAR